MVYDRISSRFHYVDIDAQLYEIMQKTNILFEKTDIFMPNATTKICFDVDDTLRCLKMKQNYSHKNFVLVGLLLGTGFV